MPKDISVTFLGTCSGGGPIPGRSCSSLALNLDGELWLVDCAEGTQTQMGKVGLRPARVTRIFITHLHIDHCMGIVPLVATILYGLSTTAPQRRIDIFGPPGLRLLLRTTFKITGATLCGKYAVHELLHVGSSPSCVSKGDELHMNEVPGRDIPCDDQGKWRMVETAANGLRVDAGPIVHRVPCIGYVFVEPPRPAPLSQTDHIEPIDRNHDALVAAGHKIPRALLGKLTRAREPVHLPDGTTLHPPPLSIAGRKFVILGDTSDPSGVLGLAEDASLLVHEATNAYVDMCYSSEDDVAPMSEPEKRAIRDKAISRGHSTADMAGAFARSIGAKRLYMNHFSTKYPDPGPLPPKSDPTYEMLAKLHAGRARVMHALENQATEAWGEVQGARAVAASDFLTVDVRAHEVSVDA